MAAKPITEAEWQLMKRLWRRAPQTAQELAADLTQSWSESTVKTLLNRLVRKGALRTEAEGKAFRYFPVLTEAESRAVESRSFVQRLFDGALSPAVAHFVEAHEWSDEELAEIERLVRRKRRRP